MILNIIKDNMLSYCLKCKRNTESINPKVLETTNGKAMILSTYAICGSKNQNLLNNKKQNDY